MKSINFEFLRPKHTALANLGGFAEHYAYSDPSSALIKLRTFGEKLVSSLFHHHGIPRIPQATFMDLLKDASFCSATPEAVKSKLHAIRMSGNRAAHGSSSQVSLQTVLWALKEAHDLAKWFLLSTNGVKAEDLPEFCSVTADGTDSKAKIKREKREILQKLADQEAQMTALLKELEEAQAKAEAAQKNQEELKIILDRAQHAVSVLDFSEEETRRHLIDEMLVAAGWDVGANGQSTEQVGQEIEVQHQPTESGLGYADYVLYKDDGTPLAVIEAKKTAYDPQKGRKQAKDYADGLEKATEQRPIIFLTNGYETYIWDDAKDAPPRQIYALYSKESLEHLHWKTANCTSLKELGPQEDIVDRMYQIEAIKSVCERFEGKRRKSLLIQATGTGKTRVAVALCELLIRARWAKRILFLCDRRELRKQAHNAFKRFIESEPRTYVNASTANDRNSSIYLATYPAMVKYYENFDPGFFDLVISDESHRSIYNRYRDLFLYFDAMQLGMTATPIKHITRNTFDLFGCENDDPTVNYTYAEAVSHTPPYLTEMRVTKHTTKFLRDGIKYKDMNEQQRRQVEEQVEDPELVDYNQIAVDKQVFNKETDLEILRNLMDNGERNADGSHVGKTIIFARNHKHAMMLQKLFDENWSQYGGNFCAVIDNYIDRAEQLIDDFKGEGSNPKLMIAISVDMLDTGIDVPEIVNLVFAKPVKSYVKFWQMIGRGTRLCKDLFGVGKDKKHFRIFDHWGNFEYFEEHYKEVEPTQSKSLMQKVFEARMALAEVALKKQNIQAFELAIDLMDKDLRALPEKSISVKEKWRQRKTLEQPGVLKQFSAATKAALRQDIAPLMQWRDIQGRSDAYQFDLLMARTQVALLTRSGEFDDLKADVLEQVSQLPINVQQVMEKLPTIDQIKAASFWANVTVQNLEMVRGELRSIMNLRAKPTKVTYEPLVLNIADSDKQVAEHKPKIGASDLAAYRIRVESVLKDIFSESPVLQKIKAGGTVTEKDIRPLVQKVLLRDPTLDIENLLEHFPNNANRLDMAIRQIIGLDAEKVNEYFIRFTQKFPDLSAHQIRFLELLKRHIANYGAIEIDRLWEDPFTQLHADGVSGVFTDDSQIDELLDLIKEINELAPSA